jgi:hypothetical protein
VAGVVEQPASLGASAFERGGAVVVVLLRVGAELGGVDLGGPAQLAGGGLGVGEDAGGLRLGRRHRVVGGRASLVGDRRGFGAGLVEDGVGLGAGLLPHPAGLDARDLQTLDALVVRVLCGDPQPVGVLLGGAADLGGRGVGFLERAPSLLLGIGLRGLDGLREGAQHGGDLGPGLIDRHVGRLELVDLELEPATVVVRGAPVGREGGAQGVEIGVIGHRWRV